MIAVATDEGAQIPLPPRSESLLAVIVLGLTGPAVEGLIHHQQSHFIAKVVENRQLRIMGRSHGIASHLLQQSEFPAQQLRRIAGTYRSTLQMFTHSPQLV